MYSCPIHAMKTQRECIVPLILDRGARWRWRATLTLIVSYFLQRYIKSIKPISIFWAKFYGRLDSLTPGFIFTVRRAIYIYIYIYIYKQCNLPPKLTSSEHLSKSYKPDTILKFLSKITSSLSFSTIFRYSLCYLVLCCFNTLNKIA